jgi:subtilisin family serine protease
MLRSLLVTAAAALALAGTAAAFVPTDPLAGKQWYLQDDHAFDAWAEPPSTLVPVKVAVIDSGLDCTLPDFQGRIADARSFVGGDPCSDTEGHGTFVAGIIAANLDTQGIVGIAYTSQLLVAKVVRTDGHIPLAAEASAIRWAADSGARVINLSLSGPRDPVHASNDSYSAEEAAAVAYAVKKGSLVVAVVGNGDDAPTEPWPYAGYPAALPHVLGVSALTRLGNVPDYSNRDAIYNDISAPGSDIFSTFPLPITGQRPTCLDQGFSDCGTDDYQDPEGTSFAAPQVAAAAAVLFASQPALTADQASAILERSADDVNAASGCFRCGLQRDPLSGWGRLDVAKAVASLAGPLPVPDRYESNDDAGTDAFTVWGTTAKLNASIDYYDDPRDVYRVAIGPHQRLTARVTNAIAGGHVSLSLWRPGTRRVDVAANVKTLRAAQSATRGAVQRVSFRSPKRGWYYVEVRATAPESGAYTLTLSKTK